MADLRRGEEFCIPSQLKTLTSNQTDSALNITKHLFLKEEYQNENMVFSPLSLHVALSMIAAGSDGSTLNELLTFLQGKSTDHPNSFASELASVVLRDAAPAGGPHLCSTNGMWFEQSISLQPSFKQLLIKDYMATLAPVDFKNKAEEVISEVNLWVEEKTNGLIKNLLLRGSANSFTRFILANALYFKGVWEEKFDASKTRDYDFHLLNGSSVTVPFMTSKEDQFIGVFDGFKVAGLSYKQGNDKRQFSMYIFLPDAKDGLLALVEQATSESGFLKRHLPNKKVEVGDFMIPKFKISFELQISDVLKEMGLVLPFSPRDAELTKMVDPLTCQENLYVDGIIHKSVIEVNEDGTKAAAVTCTMMETCCYHCPYSMTIDFVADHPFLFVIREDLTETILFIGKVFDPYVLFKCRGENEGKKYEKKKLRRKIYKKK